MGDLETAPSVVADQREPVGADGDRAVSPSRGVQSRMREAGTSESEAGRPGLPCGPLRVPVLQRAPQVPAGPPCLVAPRAGSACESPRPRRPAEPSWASRAAGIGFRRERFRGRARSLHLSRAAWRPARPRAPAGCENKGLRTRLCAWLDASAIATRNLAWPGPRGPLPVRPPSSTAPSPRRPPRRRSPRRR